MRNRKILYSVSVYSKKKFQRLYSNNKSGQQIQKYHLLLLEGLAFHENTDLKVISKLPLINDEGKIFYKKESEKIKNIQYHYLSSINKPILKNIWGFFVTSFFLIKETKKTDNPIIIGDVLNITLSIANLIVGKVKKIHTVGIVTDIPTYLEQSNNYNRSNKKSLFRKISRVINEFIIRRFDSYVFLTEAMNDLINTKNKPFVIMEGHVDENMKLMDNNIENKYEKKVCTYTGSLKRIYGIDKLIEAFIMANVRNSELHIYGTGDFEKEIIEITKKYNNIKFFGVKINDIIIQEQIKATLLVNPRPTNEAYTNFSFPSKNMEYMVSGTPTLTTDLPGMPEEYKDYVYLISDETVEGISNTLKKILSKSNFELHEKGLIAKNFVLKEKNNISQAKKIIEMINRNYSN